MPPKQTASRGRAAVAQSRGNTKNTAKSRRMEEADEEVSSTAETEHGVEEAMDLDDHAGGRRRRQRRDEEEEEYNEVDDDNAVVEDEEEDDERENIHPELLTRILHEFFEKEDTRITKDANAAVAKYVDIFVREAIARAAVERGRGFLEVEDLEKIAPQLLMDL
ncbi:uncharacterized protein CTHT_0015320 [Thermochaetoides thermophila DSM 1495]|uniref:Centromere protein X n=1 Tax=Chaetomium thermophilum (strain DSM 1495 / CBS 144.50 / IMI 039719) TaxID=759272 RepID=G0S1Y7_CHATD|nr:hypothetical protein CTHT_0015320 [Thermochaetoides thermophila DSM 1495]EGS23047.1 hypothetical protein CTHT_0015320 [Thermochaetoides thermophila DSM 1495]